MNSAVCYVNATLAGLAWISICAAGLGQIWWRQSQDPLRFHWLFQVTDISGGFFASCGEKRNPGRQQDAREYFLSSYFRHFSLCFGVMVYFPYGHIKTSEQRAMREKALSGWHFLCNHLWWTQSHYKLWFMNGMTRLAWNMRCSTKAVLLPCASIDFEACNFRRRHMTAFFYVVTWLWGYLITFQTQIHLQLLMKAWTGSLLTSKYWLGIRAPLPFQVTIARFWRNHWFFAPAIWYGWLPDLWLGIQTNDAAFWSSCCILGDSSHVSLCKMLQFATQSCMADPFGMRYQWWYSETSSRSRHLWDLKRCECKKKLGHPVCVAGVRFVLRLDLLGRRSTWAPCLLSLSPASVFVTVGFARQAQHLVGSLYVVCVARVRSCYGWICVAGAALRHPGDPWCKSCLA